MNLGGFGPADSVSRIANAKPELAKTSATSLRSVLSTEPKSDRIAETDAGASKSFRSALEKASETSRKKSKDTNPNEDLAGAGGATSTPVNAKTEKSVASNAAVKSDVAANAASGQKRPVAPPQVSDPSNVATAPVSTPLVSDVEQPTGPESSEQVDERINSIVESLQQTADTELSMRHLSMRDFLGKMKSEFGIEPQAVVKAFAGLDAAALMAPPDETAEAVLSQLKLTPDQLPKAERLYREMLNQTGESALNETLAGVGAGVSLKVLSEQDLAMEKLQSSLSSLNDSFARRNETKATADGPASAAALSESAKSLQGVIQDASPMAVATDASLNLTATDTPTESVEVPLTEKESSGSKFAAIGAALSSAAMNLTAGASGGASGDASGKGSNSSSENASKPRTEYSSIEAALVSSGFEIPPAGEKASVPLTAGTSTTAAMASAMLTNTEAESTGNAQELVRHAQILMKNGGGEMKMQLKPEGVGDVLLKVSVKDGQVAIQMLTENDSAKKLLESNLDDLKTSLAQNKLHVDAMKIEVGTEFAKQRFEQAQQDASREQARQMAQDFMGQFRQDREGFRQGFGESLGFKNYQQPRRNSLPEIEPVVVASGSQQKSGDRRLNLVA